MPRPGVLVALAALVAAPLAAHFLAVAEPVRPLAIASGWVAAGVAAVGLARAAGVAAVEGALVAGVLALAWYLGSGTRYAVCLPAGAINLLFLWFFGRTLARGRVPLVTSIARAVHEVPVLPPDRERYTRQATWAWCAFFAAMIAVSALLAAFAPLAAWSIFANVLAWPLLAVMFAAEYACRRRRFPADEHVPPLALLRRLTRAGFSSAVFPAK